MSAALIDRVRSRLLTADGEATPGRVAAALRDEGLVLGDDAVLDLVARLRDDMIGAGRLEPLLVDPGVTDVLVNGCGEVWIDRGDGLERAAVRFDSELDVRQLAQRLAAAAGRRLDDAAPHVDARLPDGVRLHAVIPPLAVDGTLLSLRIPPRRAFTLDDLLARGTIDAPRADLLRGMVQARLALLVSGGTGSGKTTVLATLLGEVPPSERIVIVEDSTELAPRHPHVVRMQARVANVEGSGQVTCRDLVRQALRMRPDRLVVGEVRGAEVIDLLAALNTGHEGGCGTVHANSATDVPARLQALGLMAGLDRAATQALVVAGLQVLIHLDRDLAGARRVTGIHVVDCGQHPGATLRTPAAFVRRRGGLRPGPGLNHLSTMIKGRGVLPPRMPAR